MKLLADTNRTTDGRLTLEIPWVEYIRSQGYTLQEYVAVHTAASNSRDGAHVVAKVKTYKYPKNNALLDVADPEHTVTVWVCSCEDFTYNKSVDPSEDMSITPGDVESCSHIQSVSKVQRALDDESQEGLNSYE